ncbi:MAG: hypothetical protein HYX68_14480 [Planctomycetes bacterium]|nr:hypothetical protein [Planctomycetota bacterium]
MPAPRRTVSAATAVKKKPRRLAPSLVDLTEWEAMKATRRNLRPADAVRECAYLSEEYRKRFGMPEISLKKIVKALQAKKISFVLTGAHGIATWTGRPRSTKDVDILVKSGRNHARAVKALRELYPELEVHNLTGVAAFVVPGERESVIDVTFPHRHDIAETLATAIWLENEGLRYRIPRLEAALANKYGAMLALNRDHVKRAQDAVDFMGMARHSTDEGRDPIDMEWLAKLGELVWPGGGGEEIIRFVEQAKAGVVPNPMGR